MNCHRFAAAALAALSLPAFAGEACPGTARPGFSLHFQLASGERFDVADIDALSPAKLAKGRLAIPASRPDTKDGGGKAIRDRGTFSRDWDRGVNLAHWVADHPFFTLMTLVRHPANGSAPVVLGDLASPILTEWHLEAENGVGATETVEFTYIAGESGQKGGK